MYSKRVVYGVDLNGREEELRFEVNRLEDKDYLVEFYGAHRFWDGLSADCHYKSLCEFLVDLFENDMKSALPTRPLDSTEVMGSCW